MGRRPSDGEAGTRSMDDRDDNGLSLLVTVLGLFVSPLLVLLVLKATVTSDGKSSPSTPSLPAAADAAQAVFVDSEGVCYVGIVERVSVASKFEASLVE